MLKSDLEFAEALVERCGSFFEAEYFLFDFNSDGKKDYLVSLNGSGFSGSGGNSVSIFLEGDVLQEIFSRTIRFAGGGSDSGYAPVMILNEKTDGLYDIVFSEYDVIWRYNEQEGQYRRK